MKEELRKKRYTEMRSYLLRLLRECSQEGVLNITTFRNLHKKEYGKLGSYFGSVSNALEEAGIIKVTSQKTSPTLIMKLAYNMIKEQNKDKSLAKIAADYQVSRAALSSLYQRLGNVIGSESH